VLDDYYASLTGQTQNDRVAGSQSGGKAADTGFVADPVKAATALGTFDGLLRRVTELRAPDEMTAEQKRALTPEQRREQDVRGAGPSVFGLPGIGVLTQGGAGSFGSITGTRAANFANRIEALKADVRAGAFETLKGGGQITEKESQFAADAIARLERTMSYDEFQKEIGDLEEYMGRLRDALLRRQGGENIGEVTPYQPPADPAQAPTNPLGVSSGTVVPGLGTFKGGDPNNLENWTPE
jgi:hypothetical protein